MLIPTFVTIMMPPNRAMAEIHDRMPAIMERGEVKNWLNGNLSGPERAAFAPPSLPAGDPEDQYGKRMIGLKPLVQFGC